MFPLSAPSPTEPVAPPVLPPRSSSSGDAPRVSSSLRELPSSPRSSRPASALFPGASVSGICAICQFPLSIARGFLFPCLHQMHDYCFLKHFYIKQRPCPMHDVPRNDCFACFDHFHCPICRSDLGDLLRIGHALLYDRAKVPQVSPSSGSASCLDSRFPRVPFPDRKVCYETGLLSSLGSSSTHPRVN